jgi:hypothetical protein
MALNTRSIESEPIMQMAVVVVPIENNFRFDVCRSLFSTISQVRDLFNRVHAGIILKFKCLNREKVFPGFRGIQCHVSKCRPCAPDPAPDLGRALGCEACGQVLKHQGRLVPMSGTDMPIYEIINDSWI